MQMMLVIVPQLVLDKIESPGIVIIILNDIVL